MWQQSAEVELRSLPKDGMCSLVWVCLVFALLRSPCLLVFYTQLTWPLKVYGLLACSKDFINGRGTGFWEGCQALWSVTMSQEGETLRT